MPRRFRYRTKRRPYTKNELEWLVTKKNRKLKNQAQSAVFRTEGYHAGMDDAFKLYLRATRTFDFLCVDFLLRTDAWDQVDMDRLMHIAMEKGMRPEIDYTHILNVNWATRKCDLGEFIQSVRNEHEAERIIDLSRALLEKGVNLGDRVREQIACMNTTGAT